MLDDRGVPESRRTQLIADRTRRYRIPGARGYPRASSLKKSREGRLEGKDLRYFDQTGTGGEVLCARNLRCGGANKCGVCDGQAMTRQTECITG